jgi:hypothetical protein
MTDAPVVRSEDDVTYRLELTGPELKMTWTALRSMLNDFGHDEPEVHRVVRDVLAKLPPAEEIKLIDMREAFRRPRPARPA